ncbi:LemA family protein [Gallaecimonas sp. GXIMD4217]|uniref:LemA family protein n=1 Tax=Gallaecimonas sp. GXIMD4217 TaxID=3131927 RepID=UPI00311B425D
MNITLIVIIAVLALLYLLYYGVVSKRNRALEALSSVDVQLQKRFDLVPNVLRIAQKFMEHEKGLLTEITALRSQVMAGYDARDKAALAEHVRASDQLNQKLGQLMVQVENYPELKSDATMVQAMQTYNEVEGHISAARRFYNAAVTDLNNAVQIFPSSLVAGMVGIGQMAYFETSTEARQAINADDYLKGA